MFPSKIPHYLQNDTFRKLEGVGLIEVNSDNYLIDLDKENSDEKNISELMGFYEKRALLLNFSYDIKKSI